MHKTKIPTLLPLTIFAIIIMLSVGTAAAFAKLFDLRTSAYCTAQIPEDTTKYCHDIWFKGVQLSYIHTQPHSVHVGDIFHVSAIVFNNSSKVLRFIAGPCDSSLSVTFDKNVLVRHGISCLLASQLVELKPGEMATTTGPAIGTTYRAVTAGMTSGSVTFHYQLDNIAMVNTTKSFVFNIIL